MKGLCHRPAGLSNGPVPYRCGRISALNPRMTRILIQLPAQTGESDTCAGPRERADVRGRASVPGLDGRCREAATTGWPGSGDPDGRLATRALRNDGVGATTGGSNLSSAAFTGPSRGR